MFKVVWIKSIRNEYLDKINHAPYFTIVMIGMGIVSLFTMFVLLGAF
ncbi:hypothetical protein CAL7102_02163 [Dulcicalothrix desertica PCC 7102]|nr:hypothetical protein CAL7102_02163 [Dulcicalothrix desertica PCC 7102]